MITQMSFPPAALARQHAMANARGMDDTASSAAGSVSSWARVDPSLPPDDLPLPPVREEPAQSELTHACSGSQFVQGPVPPPPAAPITQAAQGLLDHSNKTPAARRLRKQQEKAAHKGQRVRWGQVHRNMAFSALNSQLPEYLSQVGSGADERSVLIVDSRDRRLQSPFQGWLLDEILTNALANLSVQSDRQLVRPPSQGYHLSLFMVKTLDAVKVIICGSMTCYGGVPCARWDTGTGQVMSHQAFQPFRWPPMTESSPTWVDFKMKLEGQLILHLELRGYRSDKDMSVQLWHVSDLIYTFLQDTVFIPSCVVTIFQGWRVIAASWEVGGRLYACSDGGVVVAVDFPLCHFECRFVASSSPDAFGTDADRLEFRFLSAGDRLDVYANVVHAAPTWLCISRVSGPTLVRNAKWCREHGARVEGPDQALQLSQLAQVHAHWTAATEAPVESDTGPRISAVGVESNPMNIHLICESPLFRKNRVMVSAEALALQSHDPLDEVITTVVPPLDNGPSVRPAGSVPQQLKSLAGPSGSGPVALAPVSHVKPSITEPGVAPEPGSWQGGAVAPARRSLETRRNKAMDGSAMTPQAFVEQTKKWGGYAQPKPAYSSGPRVEELHEVEDGSTPKETSAARPSTPKSFGPRPSEASL